MCAMDEYALTEERVRHARHAYYGAISYVDDKVGQLLAVLDATGMRDNTIVLFVSDHGDMLGERGLWYKMTFFEGSARVPLLFHAPKRFAPRRVSQPVSLVDLLPTLVELANDGQPPPFADHVDGHSLLPWLNGDERNWPETALSEYLGEGAIAPVLMIRRGRYKYIYGEPDPDQLYDLVADPHELNNLAGQPDYEAIRQSFKAEIQARWDPPALRNDIIASQRRRRFLAQSLMRGRYTPWDFQPYRDASKQYMRNHLDLNELERRARFPVPPIPVPDGS
jgi:choline-sulfatase